MINNCDAIIIFDNNDNDKITKDIIDKAKMENKKLRVINYATS